MSEGLTPSASAIAYLPFRVKLKEFEQIGKIFKKCLSVLLTNKKQNS